MNSIWSFIINIFWLFASLAGIFAFFALAMTPQYLLIYFVEAGHGPMLLPLVGLFAVGHLRRTSNGSGTWLLALAVVLLWMANLRGFYWHPFPRGEGFFTANRVSANIAFVFAWYGSAIGVGVRARWTDRQAKRHSSKSP